MTNEEVQRLVKVFQYLADNLDESEIKLFLEEMRNHTEDEEKDDEM